MRVGATSQLSSAVGAVPVVPGFGAWTPSIVDFPARAGAAGAGVSGTCHFVTIEAPGAGAGAFGGAAPFVATGGAGGDPAFAGTGGGGFGGDAGPRAPAWLMTSIRCHGSDPSRYAQRSTVWQAQVLRGRPGEV